MCVCVCVCLYASTHIRYDDILVAKCVRQSLSSVCVIDCMSCWPNVSSFSLELGEKSVISSKAPFEKPHKPVIAREKAGQPAKANTWEGIGNIVNSRVTHSLSRRSPGGGRRGDVGVLEGWRVVDEETQCVKERHVQIYMRQRWQQLTVSFEAPPEELPLGFEKKEKRPDEEFFYNPKMKMTPSAKPTPQPQKPFIPILKPPPPPRFLNSECASWSPATSFMCWHNIFLVLSNKSGGLFF